MKTYIAYVYAKEWSTLYGGFPKVTTYGDLNHCLDWIYAMLDQPNAGGYSIEED